MRLRPGGGEQAGTLGLAALQGDGGGQEDAAGVHFPSASPVDETGLFVSVIILS